MSNLAIIHHAYQNKSACPDGIFSAYIVKDYLVNKNNKTETEIDLIGWDYLSDNNPDPPDIKKYNEIWIVDLSFPSIVLKSEEWASKRITIIDHHISAWDKLSQLENWLNNNHRIKFDISECAASLTWKYLFNSKIPAFLNLVKQRDIGSVWDFPGVSDNWWYLPANIFYYGCITLGKTEELYYELKELKTEQDIVEDLYNYAIPLIEKDKIQVNRILKRGVKRININGYKVGIIELEEGEDRLESPVGKFACELFKLEVAIIKKRYTYGFRSLSFAEMLGLRIFECHKFATKFGGGGHKHAAGCPYSPDLEKILHKDKIEI